MKKSEALNILGLADGATDAQVKQAHRKLVIAHHPDKFALDSSERAEAEELTKRINEARDVLLNRSWTPEFDPRRDPRPYAGNPYAHPSQNPSGSAPDAGDPFANWPFSGTGQTARPGSGQAGPDRVTYVWTSWDDPRAANAAGGNQPFDPFDPFAPFRAASAPRKTPDEMRDETKRDLQREALVIGGKLALLAAAALLGALATGLFFYVIVSVVYGLWKRIGSCLIGCMVPIALIATPFVFTIAPKEGAVTIALAVAFLIAVLFDVVNVRNLARLYRAASRAAS